MKITNKFNVPKAVVRAIENDGYSYTGYISVTQLISPPRLRWLTKRHWDELEEDCVDAVWKLLGSAVHVILERAEDKHAADFQEIRLEAETDGKIWSGQGDIWESPNILSDYKVTSAWAAVNDVKPEWEQQLNMLAYLYRKQNFEVKKLQIVAIFRDWSRIRAKTSQDYPNSPIKVIPIKLWKTDKIEKFIKERMQAHTETENTPDDELPKCTEKERWERPKQYAIMKNNNKRATKLCATEEEALEIIKTFLSKGDSNSYDIDVREGERIRCEHYCPVNKFCNQYQNYIKEKEKKIN
ncbi:hypothetical protein COV24_03555 [candidate division WWE3 bacterium CG10_big_fil_rev_8_21_14_0_10_32_10]|uniref:PD-(D/E)XK endonuclease-like domain-containing protein n=1 Tax=candidate division WWE3 bacterium CG10_big_fil_rev_8_21_14_0_10_32_10 TaxID=1975090 RepID=A0A2H0R9W8_UNCKA|nr:MAG: hypothetical protein COV24_03555 [candidate division WWE3 bacterium CG10_big_fil_rev_8_21_14_0_10_32_10]